MPTTRSAVVAVLVLVMVVLSVPFLGGVSHVLFRTDKVEAVVVGVEESGACAAGIGTAWDYTFSWNRGGERHTGRQELCGKRFQAFEHTAIWVDDDEVASTEGPWVAWGIWLLLTVLLGGTVRYVGRWRARRRTRVS